MPRRYYDNYDYQPYVTAAERREIAARELAKLRKKGRNLSPVVVEGRTIAETFWGDAWCKNLERYSDFANRLPRGRSYLRNGSVVDLQIASGTVTALVSGTTIYEVKVTVSPVVRARWTAICSDCSGAIDSVVELLQGRLSKGVMTRLCAEGTGLFPSPKELTFTCSCPDWASMCKHVAAVLYGIGARLDHQPELLFTLRKVDQQDLIAHAGSDLARTRSLPAKGKVLESDDLSDMFGIEIASTPTSKSPAADTEKTPIVGVPDTSKLRHRTTAKPKKTVSQRPPRKRLMSRSTRTALSARMKQYWAERRTKKIKE